jgi:hypothetical protein
MSDDIELVECSSCSSDYKPDELATTRGGDVLCEDCRIYCERCDNFDYSEGSRHVEGYGMYCEVCADNYTFWCERCECTYSDNHSSYEVVDIGNYWCEECCQDGANWCEDCEHYTSDSCNSCDGTNRIYDYSYKPEPVFHGSSKDGLYFGLELEMEISNDRRELSNAVEYVSNRLDRDWIYLKRDGSIGYTDRNKVGPDGFEMVSHPASFNYWTDHSQQLWDTLDGLRTKHNARSWNAKSNCGIHIHISRAGFKSGAHTHRFLSLVYKNTPNMKRFAGRDCNTYATFTDVWRFTEDNIPYMSFIDKIKSGYRSERMSAVNTNNQDTIELRFFRGTTQPKGVLATIELAHAMVEYTRNLTLSDVKLGMLEWEWFVDYISANNGLYPNAYDRIPKLSKININRPELINA